MPLAGRPAKTHAQGNTRELGNVMIAIIGILFLLVLLGGALAMRGSRTWVLDIGATEVRLKDPQTHTLAYIVPNGQDAAGLMAALAHARFTTVMDSHNGAERLLIACEEVDRAPVRRVLAEANRVRPGGTGMTAHVSFEDETERAAS